MRHRDVVSVCVISHLLFTVSCTVFILLNFTPNYGQNGRNWLFKFDYKTSLFSLLEFDTALKQQNGQNSGAGTSRVPMH